MNGDVLNAVPLVLNGSWMCFHLLMGACIVIVTILETELLRQCSSVNSAKSVSILSYK